MNGTCRRDTEQAVSGNEQDVYKQTRTDGEQHTEIYREKDWEILNEGNRRGSEEDEGKANDRIDG